MHVVFQPGEEGGTGARKRVDDGLLEQCPTAAVFGIHNGPGLPAGHNPPAETALCEVVIRETFRDERLHRDIAPNMTSEDFGFMLEERSVTSKPRQPCKAPRAPSWREGSCCRNSALPPSV